MAAVSAALLIGVLVGAFVRPFLDAYLRSATAHSYELHPLADDADDHPLRPDIRERPLVHRALHDRRGGEDPRQPWT